MHRQISTTCRPSTPRRPRSLGPAPRGAPDPHKRGPRPGARRRFPPTNPLRRRGRPRAPDLPNPGGGAQLRVRRSSTVPPPAARWWRHRSSRCRRGRWGPRRAGSAPMACATPCWSPRPSCWSARRSPPSWCGAPGQRHRAQPGSVGGPGARGHRSRGGGRRRSGLAHAPRRPAGDGAARSGDDGGDHGAGAGHHGGSEAGADDDPTAHPDDPRHRPPDHRQPADHVVPAAHQGDDDHQTCATLRARPS